MNNSEDNMKKYDYVRYAKERQGPTHKTLSSGNSYAIVKRGDNLTLATCYDRAIAEKIVDALNAAP